MVGSQLSVLPTAADAVVPGANGIVAYESSEGSHSNQTFLVNLDGSGVRMITSGPGVHQHPSFTPDGLGLVITDQGGLAVGSSIVRMVLSTGEFVPIAKYPHGGSNPSVSPDGRRIVFDSVRFGYPQLFVMDIDGSNQIRLTTNNESDWDPEWSPDGSQIAFHRSTAGDGSVFIIDADGGNERLLLENAASPSWSPDGSTIAVVGGGVWIVPVDGSGPPQLLDPSNREPHEAQSPSWSPDGTALAVSVAGGIEIWPVDGSPATVLVADPFASGPVWQPEMPVPMGLVDTSTGEWHLRDQTGLLADFYYGDPGDVPILGDWNCDGIDTPGLYRQSDGYVYLRNSNTQGIADIRFYFGNPSDIPLAGDFNGDGCDTLSIYRPENQTFYIMNKLGDNESGLGAAEYSFIFGNPGDKPVVGDWDGDGVDEIGLHRESTGFFYYRNTLTTGVADGEMFFGDPGDRFIAGDWGIVDGRETPGVFRPSNSTFYFRYNLTQGNADAHYLWGQPDWVPVAGTYLLP